MMARLFIAGAALTFVCFAQPAHAQQPCESLAGLKLPSVTITSARMVAEGPFAVAGAQGGANAPPLKVPAHCEIKGIIKPTADSSIGFAVWLPPPSNWNGKYRQEGNGGWAGAIGYRAMIDPLQASLKIAGSGMEVQSTRLRVISENVANAQSTGATPGSNPYVRKTISFDNEMGMASLDGMT